MSKKNKAVEVQEKTDEQVFAQEVKTEVKTEKKDKKVNDKKNAKNGKKKDQKEKGKLKRKVKEAVSELKKVTWPTFGEVCKKTGVVLVVVLVFAVVIFGMDTGLYYLVKLLRK